MTTDGGKMKTASEMADAVREYEAHTTGSESLHIHWTGHLRYTDGMLFMAEECSAHWLLDAVASYQPEIPPDEFQVWRMRAPETDDGPWVLDAWTDTPDDEDSTRLVRQEIPYSDFPAELAPFVFYVEFRTAMLRRER